MSNKSKKKYPNFLPEPEQSLPSKGPKLAKDDFKPVSNLGQGSFGKVYKVIHKSTENLYAIKVIGKSQISNLKMTDQLRNEIAILQIVSHKNIVKMTTYFEDEANIYLVMELGGYVYEAASAVAYLHDRNPPIIHRDIKPENLLVCNGILKMADFGWSNIKDRKRQTYCGTPDYLAPEMIDGSGHNEKLDVWSLGVLTYELLTGKAPFTPKKTDNRREKMKKLEINIMRGNFSIPKNIPQLAAKLIKKILRKDPDLRPTAREIMRDPWFVSLGMVERPPVNHPVSSVSSRRLRQNQMKGSRRNYSSHQRDPSPSNRAKNHSVDYSKNNIFNSPHEEQGKFCTKKTVAKTLQDSFSGQLYSNSQRLVQKIANQSFTELNSNYKRTHSRDRSAGRRGQEPKIHPQQYHKIVTQGASFQTKNAFVPTYGTPRRVNHSPSIQLRSHSKGNYQSASNGFVDQHRAVSREKTQIKNPPLPINSTQVNYGNTAPAQAGYFSTDQVMSKTDSFRNQRKNSGNGKAIRTQNSYVYSNNGLNTSQISRNIENLTKSYLDGNISESVYSKTLNLQKQMSQDLGNLPTNLPKSKSGRIIKQKVQSSTNLDAYSSQISSNSEMNYNPKSFHKSHTMNPTSNAQFEEATKHLKFYQQNSNLTSENISPKNNFQKLKVPEEINWKLKYLEEKNIRQKIESDLKSKDDEIMKLNKKILEEYKKSNKIINRSKEIETENSKLKSQLRESISIIESMKSLKTQNSNLELESKYKKLDDDHTKLQKIFMVFQAEVFSLAKKLKEIKPKWRPNTQNQKIFIKEVLKELWKQLRTLMLEKEEASRAKNSVSNKEFINNQFSEKKTIRNGMGDESGGESFKEKFEASMMILCEVIQNIDEINNSFDDSVKDDSGNLDSQRLFPALILFFEKMERLRSQFEFKKLMRDYYG